MEGNYMLGMSGHGIYFFLLNSWSLLTTLSRFNSGKFAVPWQDTEAIIKQLEMEMVVYDPVTT